MMKKIIIAMLVAGLLLIGCSLVSQMIDRNKTSNTPPITETIKKTDDKTEDTSTAKAEEGSAEVNEPVESAKDANVTEEKNVEEKSEGSTQNLTLPEGMDNDFTKKQQEFRQKMDEMKEKFEEMQKTMNENVEKMQVTDMPDMSGMFNTPNTPGKPVEQDDANK